MPNIVHKMAKGCSLSHSSPLHVAVGVIKDNQSNILISLRHDKAHQGELWEFPGGKVEGDESVQKALVRELKEELGISVLKMQPLITVRHRYTDLEVFLDVWVVSDFSGIAQGCEGQRIKWVSADAIGQYTFPEANDPIITAAVLPTDYAILNDTDEGDLIQNLQRMLDKGIRLIQVRVKSLSAESVEHFFEQAWPLCQVKKTCLMVNSSVKNADKVNAEGLHLTSKDLLAIQQKPVGYKWVAASCHNHAELQHAEQIGIDFVVLAPVLATKTHPETEPLGWHRFGELASSINIPIYALGGLTQAEKSQAQNLGAQGISGIGTFLY